MGYPSKWKGSRVERSLRLRKKAVIYKVSEEPFEASLAFLVPVVFLNFDPSKSLPILATVKGQRSLNQKKKKNSWDRYGNQIAAVPGFWP